MKVFKSKIWHRIVVLSVLLAMMLSCVNWGTLSVSANPGGGSDKKLNVYFISWAYGTDLHQKQHVEDLPWDRISTINHAFWKIDPVEAAAGTSYPIVSADPAADLIHFAAYEQMLNQYPEVKVVLSVGGWNDTKWFAKMASTVEGRESFIDSCVETLQTYTWLGGIDIDWEYPGTARNAEGEGFEGSAADKDNFTELMKGLREAFDAEGLTDKILTYCASTNVGVQDGPNATVLVDYKAIEPYVDRVNVMTYDMATSGTLKGYHHAALYEGNAVRENVSVDAIVTYLKGLGVDLSKVNIGSPLYSQGWVIPTDPAKTREQRAEEALGKDASKAGYGAIGGGQMYWFDLKAMEADTDAWVLGYDETSEAAYLYNTDPASTMYQQFYTYENERSLQAKLDYINSEGLGGLIVWSTPGDGMYELNPDGTFATTGGGERIKEKSFPMLTQMAIGLGIYNGPQTSYDPAPYAPPSIAQANPVGFWSDDVQWNPGDIAIYNTTIGECLAQTHVDGGETPETTWGFWNKIGTYTTPEDFVAEFGDNIPAWNDGCTWYTGAIVEYNGRYFRALANTHIDGGEHPETTWGYWTLFHQPDDWAEPEVGTPLANPVGFWSDDVQWNPGDIAICNEVIARCIATTTVGGWETPEVEWGVWYWEQIGTYTTPENFVAEFGDNIPAWNDDCIWRAGAIVEYRGRYWTASYDTHIGGNEHPETTWGYWTLFYQSDDWVAPADPDPDPDPGEPDPIPEPGEPDPIPEPEDPETDTPAPTPKPVSSVSAESAKAASGISVSSYFTDEGVPSVAISARPVKNPRIISALKEQTESVLDEMGVINAEESSKLLGALDVNVDVPSEETVVVRFSVSDLTPGLSVAAIVRDSEGNIRFVPVELIPELGVVDIMLSGGTFSVIIVEYERTVADSMSSLTNAEASAVFDAEYYANRYPDVAAACGNNYTLLFNHFLAYGLKEGRAGSPIFDIAFYQMAYPDLWLAFGNDPALYVKHFLQYGNNEDRLAGMGSFNK